MTDEQKQMLTEIENGQIGIEDLDNSKLKEYLNCCTEIPEIPDDILCSKFSRTDIINGLISFRDACLEYYNTTQNDFPCYRRLRFDIALSKSETIEQLINCDMSISSMSDFWSFQDPDNKNFKNKYSNVYNSIFYSFLASAILKGNIEPSDLSIEQSINLSNFIDGFNRYMSGKEQTMAETKKSRVPEIPKELLNSELLKYTRNAIINFEKNPNYKTCLKAEKSQLAVSAILNPTTSSPILDQMKEIELLRTNEDYKNKFFRTLDLIRGSLLVIAIENNLLKEDPLPNTDISRINEFLAYEESLKSPSKTNSEAGDETDPT